MTNYAEEIKTGTVYTHNLEGKLETVNGVAVKPETTVLNKDVTPSNDTRPVRMVTDNQRKKYLELCLQKGVVPADVTKMTSKQASEAIEGLLSFYPASDKQKQLVRDLVTELNEYGDTIKPLSEYQISRLGGGREGKASSIINMLQERRKKYLTQIPPSQSQVDRLVEMMYCPACPFDSFGIESRVYLEEFLENGQQMWRLKTSGEFAEAVRSNMTHAEASKFIDDYRADFYEWKRTRITDSQKRFIRSKESRMNDVASTRTQEFGVDMEGNIIELDMPSARESMPANAYTPLSEEQLNMLSVEEASKLIEQMNWEFKNFKYAVHTEATVDGEHDKHKLLLTDSAMMKAYQVKTFEDLNNLLYAIQAVAGVEIEYFQNELARLIMSNPDGVQVKSLTDEISEWVFSLIKEEYISFRGVMEMVDRCEFAEEIIMSKFK